MPARKLEGPARPQMVETMLDLMGAVESGEQISQRDLSKRLDVALGLANSLVKRCVRKGYLKVRSAPARRFAYYLTPKGFAEKSRLTHDYLVSSLSFFRRARTELSELFDEISAKGWTNVAIIGRSDLAEICILTAHETGLEPIALVDASSNTQKFFSVPVYRSLSEIPAHTCLEALIITDMDDPQEAYLRLSKTFPPDRIFWPPLMRLNRNAPVLIDGDE